MGMIMHHKGAVSMAKKVLTLNPRNEIQSLEDQNEVEHELAKRRLMEVVSNNNYG